ncbi:MULTISPECIES: DUF6671 family protein [Chryseobacterium]|uniref:DUF6671 domain-containing protein n=1 Tax=Chryseobacterium taihuense TaxID=1141221 RepID=A0A4U8WHN2_9FLAO|nr:MULTISPECIES: DUF6671 family protein [Chryseobacterium]QQV02159.1 hypothetical protein I6I61_13930 [Chryseobacterium sp. FDAARGOS 1104]VFB04605.1 Uncharacterised protein [Chryseobacterium taihuense]
MFEGRTLLIATKHQKEKVITPIFEKELGVKCIVSQQFDTDVLGTFTGEVERKNDPLSTVKEKCRTAMNLENCDLAIASEGSFGAHPNVFFASADEEFLVLLDEKNKLEIIAREVSLETNFAGTEVLSEKELLDFAAKAGFPQHGLIIRKGIQDSNHIVKGITDETKLLDTFEEYQKLFGKAFVETDMRAMYNPTRMRVIEKTAKKLVEKIKNVCPDCQMPGFDITKVVKGLPCEQCGFPTKSTLSYVYSCKKCDFEKEEKYPNQKKHEDPMYCDFCNP